jgi:hypothetical protein
MMASNTANSNATCMATKVSEISVAFMGASSSDAAQ